MGFIKALLKALGEILGLLRIYELKKAGRYEERIENAEAQLQYELDLEDIRKENPDRSKSAVLERLRRISTGYRESDT